MKDYSDSGRAETLAAANAAIAAARAATPAKLRDRYSSQIRSVRAAGSVLYYWSWS